MEKQKKEAIINQTSLVNQIEQWLDTPETRTKEVHFKNGNNVKVITANHMHQD